MWKWPPFQAAISFLAAACALHRNGAAIDPGIRLRFRTALTHFRRSSAV
jgi:hypothetical protein